MIQKITAQMLDQLAAQATGSDRLRANHNVHKKLDASVQRLFIATEPGTYMRPHRHPQPHKWEFFVVLAGEIDLLVFDDAGRLLQRTPLSPTTTRAAEVPPNLWHAYVCKKPGTLALEIKEGAYIPTPEEDFAPWSPAENTAAASTYLAWMCDAQVSKSA